MDNFYLMTIIFIGRKIRIPRAYVEVVGKGLIVFERF
jgi:hypothetical protein